MQNRLLLFFLLIWGIILQAQTTEVGLTAGAAFYRGELSSDNFLDFGAIEQPALGFQVRFSPFTRFSGRLEGLYAKVASSEENTANITGLNFQSTIYNAQLLLEWNMVDANFGPSTGLTPYLFGGVGGIFFESQGEYQGELLDLQPLGTEGQGLEGYEGKYNQLNAAIPLGLGIRFWLGDRISLLVEGSTRFLFTDYLDDVSNTAVIYEDILNGNGPEAAALSNPNIVPGSDEATQPYRRGDARNDGLYFLNLTVTYRTDGGRMGIKVRKNCPTF